MYLHRNTVHAHRGSGAILASGRLAMLLSSFVFAALSACSDIGSTMPASQAAPRDSSAVDSAAAPNVDSVARWSDPASWPDGVVPAEGADVTIAAGSRILLDVSPPALRTLRINGALMPGAAPVELRVGTVYVKGTLAAGAADRPHLGSFTVTLLERSDDPDPELAKGIIVLPGGTLDLFGERRTSWLHLGATAPKGAQRLVLERASGWRAGDRIVIAPSGYEQDDTESRTIASVEGDGTTLVLDAPLAATHWGELQTIAGRTLDERAEVGLITHNVVVRGDSASEIAGHGGHIMVLPGASAHLDGVELHRMGQRGRLARYPFHWHVAGQVPGQYVVRSSVWHSYNRCMTIHGTHDARLEDNVCYDHEGHGYFLEDGIETGNTLKHNLAVYDHPGSILHSDASPTSFWITNPDNTFEYNVAAGSMGQGYWIAPPLHPTGMSATEAIWPSNTPLRRFHGNVAHSIAGNGVMVEGEVAVNGYYSIDYRPRTTATPDGAAAAEAIFSGLTVYSSYRGFWMRGDHPVIRDAIFADNVVGAQIGDAALTSSAAIEGSLIVGRSRMQLGRSQPPTRAGFVLYDGDVALDGVTFAAFTSGSGGAAYAIRAEDRFDGRMSPANRARNIHFVDVAPESRVYLAADPTFDGERQALMVDEDGSIAGAAGTIVSSRNAFIQTQGCDALNAAANAVLCRTDYVAIRVANREGVAPAEVTDARGRTTRYEGYTPTHLQMNAAAGGTYLIRPVNGPVKNFSVEMERLRTGVATTVVVPWPLAEVKGVWGGSRGKQVLPRVADPSQLEASAETAFWFDAAQGLVHIRFVGNGDVLQSLNLLEP